jgi:hypothetical protein
LHCWDAAVQLPPKLAVHYDNSIESIFVNEIESGINDQFAGVASFPTTCLFRAETILGQSTENGFLCRAFHEEKNPLSAESLCYLHDTGQPL